MTAMALVRSLLVLVLCAGTVAHADNTAKAAVALLPLDAEAKLEVYGQPVASEIAQALIAAQIDVVVVLPKMAVPEHAKLIVDGKIASAKGGAIELSIRVRDPKSGTVLQTLHASAPSLANIDLSGADLSGANLQEARATGAKFVGANLQNTDFDTADLSKSDFSNANLRGANLAGTTLSGVNWSGADLSGAQFPAGKDNYGMPLARRCAEGSIGACR